MTSSQIVLCMIVALVCAVWAQPVAAVCPITTCSPTDPNAQILWFNTTTSSLRIRGPEMTIFPVTPSGQTVDTAWARLELHEIAELNGLCTDERYTIETATEDLRVARALNLSTACCSSGFATGTLPGGVDRDMVIMNITRPEFPDLDITVTISLSHDTVIISKPDTTRTDGPYDIIYAPGKPKVDVDISNWPWIADEQPGAGHGDTWLQFFFYTEARLDQVGNVTARDFGQSFELAAVSPLVDIRINMLQVMTFDGVDIYSPMNSFGSLNFESVEHFGPFPGILLMCDEFMNPILPRYQNFSWDPTLSAVFTPPVIPEAPGAAPEQKKSNRTTAIAVGVSVGVVVVLVAIVALLFVFVPYFRHLVVSK